MRWPRSWHPEDPAPHRAAVFILPLIAHRLPLPTPLIAPSPIPPLKRYPESRCRGITAGLLERGLEVRLRGLQSIIVLYECHWGNLRRELTGDSLDHRIARYGDLASPKRQRSGQLWLGTQVSN